MKRCPKCQQTYMDEKLKFCRVDGAALLSFDSESATAVFRCSPATDARTEKVTSRARRAARPKAIDSIAVLPFENTSNDPNTEYVSDGITESIINNLSQLPKLKVMARSTVFRLKDQRVDPQSVGDELGVRAVVTGRVLHAGDHLNVGIELVNVADGSQLGANVIRDKWPIS